MAKRILRLTASPHAIAAGVAAGVFASFTPFLGFHFIIAFTVSYVIAGNFLAAALGTFFGNPFSFPLIWASTFATGKFILSGASHSVGIHEDGPKRLGEIAQTDMLDIGFSGLIKELAGLWDPVVKPMMIGAIPLGVLAGIIAYLVTRWIAIGFRAARKRRLSAKARALQGKPQRGKKIEPANEKAGSGGAVSAGSRAEPGE